MGGGGEGESTLETNRRPQSYIIEGSEEPWRGKRKAKRNGLFHNSKEESAPSLFIICVVGSGCELKGRLGVTKIVGFSYKVPLCFCLRLSK